MKLLFDATELSYLYENSGHKAGVFYVAQNLLKEFQKYDIDITLVCDFKRYYFLKNIKEFENYKILTENSLMNLILAKILFYTDKFPLKFKYAFIILARFYDKYLYKTNKKNLAQLSEFDAYFSPFTPPSKEIEQTDIKRFRMIHDIIPIIENRMPKSPKDWYYKIYSTINNKDYYLTNSEHTKKDLLKTFPFIKKDNIKTTLLGASEKFYPTKENSPIEGNYIFSLCTLGKRKNLIFAIKNFFNFINRHQIKDLKLVLGGGIWKKYEKELASTLAQYDTSRIILTGYIEEIELNKYYSNALCFVYPSLYEGFGLPVLEAMQCGCPVITSNRSSLPEVIGDAGIMVNPESNEDMILAYEKMYFDSSFRSSCSKKSFEQAKLFSWEKCAKEILDFIKSTL